MGCLVVQFSRVGGNVSAGSQRVGGGMSAWLGLVCGTSLSNPYLRVCDGGYVLTVDGGYIMLNEPYKDLNDGRE